MQKLKWDNNIWSYEWDQTNDYSFDGVYSAKYI